MSEVAASASLGPRYAPEDPTLPKPWMGLIDGSTGLQYYWNPETNITQYERPAGGPPPLPPGPPPPVATPSLTAVPTSQNSQPNGPQGQPAQQIFQQPQLGQQNQQQQGGLQMPYQQGGQQVYPQQGHQMSFLQSDQQLQNQRVGQQLLQHSLGQQLPRQPSPQQQPPSQQLLPQQLAEHQLQPGQQVPQTQLPSQQLPLKQPGQQQLPHQQLEQQLMHQQSGQQQLPHQQPGQQQFPYQQPGVQLRPQFPHQTSQHFSYQQVPFLQGQKPPGQQLAYQNIQQSGIQSIDEPSLRNWKPSDFPTTEPQPSGGIPPKPNLSAGIQQAQVPHLGVRPPQAQHQFSGFLRVDAQQSGATSFQVQPNVNTLQHQDQIGGGVRPQSQVGPRMMANRMSMGSPAGINEFEDDKNDKPRDEFYSGRPKDFPGMGQMQPKLAPLPLPRNVQDTRIGVANPQMFSPGHSAGFNMAPVRSMPNMYNNAPLNQPFPNGLQIGSPGMLVSSDLPHLSAVDLYRKKHEVTAMGENIPAPFITFETTGFPPEILREMHFAGFLSPTPIQAQTWPIALQGRDIVAIAKTGSGKTLGYLVPAFLHLRQFHNNPQMGPTVLILAPTRELATQIQDEAVKFGRSSGISCTCLYGGAPKGPQLREIERGASIVVATPGRLNDILEMNKISFCQVSFLVLDEADRMLDMGFEPQIRKIVNEIPPRRQTLMYTATWPKEVRKIAGDLLFNPVQVNIGNINELAANKAITQYVEVVSPMMKDRRLEEILRSQERGSKIIIFCSTKRLCDQLARGIGGTFGATAIHGDKSQGERDWALNQFRSGKSPILVATDVAARGLDIKDIRVVINYDFPTGVEDYVHRIGRTGRAGATGVAYTFFSDQDWKYAVDLIKILEGSNQQVPPELREVAVRGGPILSKDRAGISRWDSGGGRFDTGGPRGMRDGDYEGRGGREGSFRGRGGRDVGFGGRGGRDGGLGGRGGRDGVFGGRGGRDGFDGFGGRDIGGFGGRGGRSDFYGSRGGRGRGFGGQGGMGRGGRGPNDRHGYMEGRSRFDSRRPMGPRSRGRSYSRSPDRGRSWSRHRSRSISRSRSRSRSWTRSRSYSRSKSRSRSRSGSRSFDVPQRNRRASGFDVLPTQNVVPPPVGEMSPMSPGTTNAGTFPMTEPIIQTDMALLTDGATANDVQSSGT